MRHVDQLEVRRLLASFTASSVAGLVADINAANAAGGSNTITLAPGALFKLGAVDNTIDGPTGLPVIAAGDSLTILGNGGAIQRSTAGGTPAFRVLAVAAGGSLSLNNLVVSGGLSAGPPGGGIFNEGTLSLDGVTLQNCAAQGQSPFGSWGFGGGIYSVGALAVTNSSIRNNQATGGNGRDAGGTFLQGPYPGGAGAGGGVYVGGGTATLTSTTISSNLARGGVGGNGGKFQNIFGKKGFLYVRGAAGGDGLGGGIDAASGTVTLRATAITANTAIGGAGGNSPNSLSKGADGVGEGGGIYIGPSALVSLDSFTQAHTSGNSASTSDNDIFGSFTIL